jgi:malate synthase
MSALIKRSPSQQASSRQSEPAESRAHLRAVGASNDLNGIEVLASISNEQERVLTPEALAFVARLQRRFNPTRQRLLSRRREVQARLDQGDRPGFLRETADIRNGSWRIATVPKDLRDRRVEITGPVDRKMIINALNSGAQVYMADFEDAHSPSWAATLDGQINLRDAIRRTISYTAPQEGGGKNYTLNEKTSVLIVRPRGWHLPESHVSVDGEFVSASLFDFGLYFFHNARELIARGTGPYFYLPKLENHLEARLWNEVFVCAEEALGIPRGTIKATVLIETVLAAFEMDEILYELRDHVVGLNVGRWDYIFSFIKKFKLQDFALLPDRALVTMNSPFLRSYSELLIHTAHKRGAHAMGGMAAAIPIRQVSAEDVKAHQVAMRQVRNDKEREVKLGHDGTWVAHPGLVQLAQEAFNESLHQQPSQLWALRDQFSFDAKQLLEPPTGVISEHGVRKNLRVALLYLQSWLHGKGSVPIDHLMEDAATAEISRAQIWQWLRHPRAVLADGRRLSEEQVRLWMGEELAKIAQQNPGFAEADFDQARALLENLIFDDNFADFLTLKAYPLL